MSLETHTAAHNKKNIARVVIVNDKGQRILDTLVKPQTTELALKPGIKSQMFKLSQMRAEHIDVVRERVLSLIKGKKLVGYHLPQKIADLGLLGELDGAKITPESVLKPESNPLVPNALQETEKSMLGMAVPNNSDKKKYVLQITEAYDMAKLFNAELSAQQ